MKKLLYITHLSGKRVNRFWLTAIAAAHELGYEFHLACNMTGAEQPEFDEGCKQYGIITHHIDFNRNPLSGENRKAYKELIELLKKEQFDIVHCNTPVGGLLGRLCSHKAHVPYVIYQAHGFHFWKGAPAKNWMFYYPVEKYLSKYTDALITINQEDYAAANKFNAKQVYYVPGVGIDQSLFTPAYKKNLAKRDELGLSRNDFVVLSVGELIPRKNHEVVIRAIAEIMKNFPTIPIHYLICGSGGGYQDQLLSLTNSLNLNQSVHFLGYRTDVNDIYSCVDAFAFMSYQEGLPVALMEAMASGVPCICSDIRGNSDLIHNGENGWCIKNDISALADAIIDCYRNPEKASQFAEICVGEIDHYSVEKVTKSLAEIYRSKP